jgi:hypothetical protein
MRTPYIHLFPRLQFDSFRHRVPNPHTGRLPQDSQDADELTTGHPFLFTLDTSESAPVDYPPLTPTIRFLFMFRLCSMVHHVSNPTETSAAHRFHIQHMLRRAGQTHTRARERPRSRRVCAFTYRIQSPAPNVPQAKNNRLRGVADGPSTPESSTPLERHDDETVPVCLSPALHFQTPDTRQAPPRQVNGNNVPHLFPFFNRQHRTRYCERHGIFRTL